MTIFNKYIRIKIKKRILTKIRSIIRIKFRNRIKIIYWS